MYRVVRFFTAVLNFTKCRHLLFILSLYGIDLRRNNENNWNCKLASLVYKWYSTYFVRRILLLCILCTFSFDILEFVLCSDMADGDTFLEECLLSAQTLALYGSFEFFRRRKLILFRICEILRIDLPNEKLEFPSIFILTSTLVLTSMNILHLFLGNMNCFVSNEAVETITYSVMIFQVLTMPIILAYVTTVNIVIFNPIEANYKKIHLRKVWWDSLDRKASKIKILDKLFYEFSSTATLAFTFLFVSHSASMLVTMKQFLQSVTYSICADIMNVVQKFITIAWICLRTGSFTENVSIAFISFYLIFNVHRRIAVTKREPVSPVSVAQLR